MDLVGSKNTFVVIPAYNEEKNLKKVLEELKLFGYNIVVVDDGSRDGTYSLAKSCGVIALRHGINRGQGAALETGDRFALKYGADIIVHFDADGQFLADEIKDMIEPILKNEAQVVFGSRFLEKRSDIPWLKKNMIMPLARAVNYLLLGVTITDPQSGFRAFSSIALNSIRIENDGMAHCSEILAKVFRKKFIVKEVPITVIYHHFGQKFGGGIKILKDLFLSKMIN